MGLAPPLENPGSLPSLCVCVGCGGGGSCVMVDRFKGDRRSLTALHLNSSLMSREP